MFRPRYEIGICIGILSFILITGCSGTAKPGRSAPSALAAGDASSSRTLADASSRAVSQSGSAGSPSDNYSILQAELRRILKTAPHPERIGACVQEVDSSFVVFEHNGGSGFTPVSSQKLLTTAAALDILGSNYTYLTRAMCAGQMDGKTLRGNLILVGSGDPTIGGRLQPDPRDTTAVFRQMAADVRSLGIERIDGAVVGDNGFFDDERLQADWPDAERGEAYMAPVSALSFNENCVDVFLEAGGFLSGGATRYETAPTSNYYLFQNNVRTGDKKQPARVRFTRKAGANLIQVQGTIPRGSTCHAKGAIDNPTLYAATVFREVLLRQQIDVTGVAALDMDDLKESAPQAAETWPAAVHVSPPLSEIVSITNHFNVNHYAEMLLKTIGKKKNGTGSFEAGCAAVEDFLSRRQLSGYSHDLRDGSGLSRRNSLSPRLVAELLRRMAEPGSQGVFADSLAKGGEPGVLQGRLGAAMGHGAAARIRAIAGSYAGCSDLAGYAVSAGGDRFAFVFLLNDPALSPEEAERLLDALALAVSQSRILGVNAAGG